MTRSRRLLLIVCVVLIAAGGYAVWRWPAKLSTMVFGPPAGAAAVIVSGNIEAHQSVLSFTQVQAPIVTLAFDEGATVTRGYGAGASLDDRIYRNQVEIDRANLGVATAQVAVSESNLAAAQSNGSSDSFDLSEKRRDYARAEELIKTAAASLQSRDLALTAARQSEAMLSHDRAMVRVAVTNVALAHANETALSAKLALDQVMLDYTTMRAPFDGVISVRAAELGQLAGPGVAIFMLDDLDHVWLRAYVNEPDIGRVRLNQQTDVTTDTYPGQEFTMATSVSFRRKRNSPRKRLRRTRNG